MLFGSAVIGRSPPQPLWQAELCRKWFQSLDWFRVHIFPQGRACPDNVRLYCKDGRGLFCQGNLLKRPLILKELRFRLGACASTEGDKPMRLTEARFC